MARKISGRLGCVHVMARVYKSRAERRMVKSALGVQEVEETRSRVLEARMAKEWVEGLGEGGENGRTSVDGERLELRSWLAVERDNGIGEMEVVD